VLWWVVLDMRTFGILTGVGLALSVTRAYAAPPMTTIQDVLVAKRLNANGTPAPTRSNNIRNDVISYDDCVEDRAYSIVLTSIGAPDPAFNLEVWAGTSDCTPNPARRQVNTQACWKVLPDLGQNGTGTQIVRVRDIVANDLKQGQNYVNVRNGDACAALGKNSITVYFMWLRSGDMPGIPATGNPVFNVDTSGPPAPTGLRVAAGEDLLIATWDAPKTVADLTSYRVYCEELDEVADASTPQGDAQSDAGAADASDDAMVSLDADIPDATTIGDATATDATVTDAGADARASAPECPSRLLVAGQLPPASLTPCAEAQGTIGTSQNILGRKNGVRYAVAVAAVNKSGNSSPLSNIACGSPEPVDTFLDQYKAAGGGAVGCSTSGTSPSLAALGIVSVAILARLRKRRQS
jgi:MYXO-CTERM domain-containing protein